VVCERSGPYRSCLTLQGANGVRSGSAGVGPREWLEPLNIPVVADLPVGKNLQDHLFTVHVRGLCAAIPGLLHSLSGVLTN